MSVLVTGGSGCLGSHLVRGLVASGEDVRVLTLPGDPAVPLADMWDVVERRVGDVCDPGGVRSAMDGVDAVFHLAGVAAPLNALRARMEAVNVHGTANVMRAAREAGVARVVHVSSVSAVGWPDGPEPVDETFPFNGGAFHHAYVDTKRRGEDAVRREVDAGLDAVIVNPSPVMASGGDLRYGWASMVAAVRRGLVVAAPGGGISMTPARDFVDAMLRARARGRTGERYIVASHHLRHRELAALIARVVGGRAPRLRLPDRVVIAAAACGSLAGRFLRQPPLLARENAPLLTRTMYFDQGKGARELGLGRTPLEPAVREVDAWLRLLAA